MKGAFSAGGPSPVRTAGFHVPARTRTRPPRELEIDRLCCFDTVPHLQSFLVFSEGVLDIGLVHMNNVRSAHG
jgi:hypothetical protein